MKTFSKYCQLLLTFFGASFGWRAYVKVVNVPIDGAIIGIAFIWILYLISLWQIDKD